MNEADLENKFNAILRELEKMNRTLIEIRDKMPAPSEYKITSGETLMEK
ncbi:MAG: hypothetical protein ABFD10_11395 [Prolixibacteraceae bacterium]|jgi:hypothetical protein